MAGFPTFGVLNLGGNTISGQVSQSIVAPEVIVVWNSQNFGIASSFQCTLDYGNQPIPELDNQVIREIVPGLVRCEFSISGYMTRTADLQNTGVFSAPGDNLVNDYNSVSIIDRRSQAPICTIPSVMINTFSLTIQSPSFLMADISGIGFGFYLDSASGLASINPNLNLSPRST